MYYTLISQFKPGRVATILSDPLESVWGVAYQVEGLDAIDMALKHLAEREMITGGYHFEKALFYPKFEPPFYIQVYIADSVNKQYLGDADIILQAYQIFQARGVCGPNIEYVRKVVDFMKNEVPGGLEEDKYLFALDDCIRQLETDRLQLSQYQLDMLPIRVQEAQGDEEFARLKRNESVHGSVHSLSGSVGSSHVTCACGGRHTSDSLADNGVESNSDWRTAPIHSRSHCNSCSLCTELGQHELADGCPADVDDGDDDEMLATMDMSNFAAAYPDQLDAFVNGDEAICVDDFY